MYLKKLSRIIGTDVSFQREKTLNETDRFTPLEIQWQCESQSAYYLRKKQYNSLNSVIQWQHCNSSYEGFAELVFDENLDLFACTMIVDGCTRCADALTYP